MADWNQLEERDPQKAMENLKRAMGGQAPQVDPSLIQQLPPGSNGVVPGHAYPDSGGMSPLEQGAADQGAANVAQAQTDPAMAAKLQAMQAAVQQFKDRQAGMQMDKLQALPSVQAKKKKPEVYSAEE